MRMTKQDALGRLQRLIDCAAPASGDRLPTERRMAETLGCSRATLRAALAELESRGQIWRRVGQGTFRGRAPIGQPLRDAILIEATTSLDLMDARVLLEPQVAAAAAERREPADIAHLRDRVAAGRRAGDHAACERADDAFHQAIAEVTRNPVLIALLRHFSGTRCRSVWQREWDRTYRRVGVDAFRHVHSDQHQAIVDAIAAGDAEAARREMAGHLALVRQAIRAASSGPD
ncbi:FadR/GntR family transcriptional regulator [Marinovum algicola]|uniref:FadR/GntR family transcriptional regulator n=1 Tax=Marinovum algicola TaxID=42444 RepID=UPI0024B953D0|nr:FCD domain-containing protein [Marinovum algicola]